MQICWHSLSPIRDIFNHFPMFSCANAALACHFPGCHATSAAADTRFRGRTGIFRGEIKLFCGRKKIFRGRIRRFRGSLYRTMQRMCQSTRYFTRSTPHRPPHVRHGRPAMCPLTQCHGPPKRKRGRGCRDNFQGVRYFFPTNSRKVFVRMPDFLLLCVWWAEGLALPPCRIWPQPQCRRTGVSPDGKHLQVPTIDLLYIL